MGRNNYEHMTGWSQGKELNTIFEVSVLAPRNNSLALGDSMVLRSSSRGSFLDIHLDIRCKF